MRRGCLPGGDVLVYFYISLSLSFLLFFLPPSFFNEIVEENKGNCVMKRVKELVTLGESVASVLNYELPIDESVLEEMGDKVYSSPYAGKGWVKIGSRRERLPLRRRRRTTFG